MVPADLVCGCGTEPSSDSTARIGATEAAEQGAAVAASQYMANFFVDQARGSSHRYETAEEEWKALVYTKTTSTSMAPGFAQIYTFRGDED